MIEPDYEHLIDLRPERPGKSARGSKTVELILQAAAHVLIEEGSASFTLRRIAKQCNLRIGNVTRHFPRKEMLVQLLLHEIMTSIENVDQQYLRDSTISPEKALMLIITGGLDDVKTKRSTHLMTEIWAMSNHNKLVAERLNLLLKTYQEFISFFIRAINPSLDDDQVESVAVYVSATTEGMTVLAGHGRSWEKKMPHMKAIATKYLIDMIKTITPRELPRL